LIKLEKINTENHLADTDEEPNGREIPFPY
jgi:hypothetical protein